jgi:hypothetical protein
MSIVVVILSFIANMLPPLLLLFHETKILKVGIGSRSGAERRRQRQGGVDG